jgi:hypothetical protein
MGIPSKQSSPLSSALDFQNVVLEIGLDGDESVLARLVMVISFSMLSRIMSR